MTEIILSVVTKTVLAKAISLASEEISRAWGVDKDLQTLAGKIEMIEALLSDAGNKEPDIRAVQLWLRNLQAVAIDANNLLDSISYEALRKTIEKGKLLMKVRNYLSSSNPVVFRFHVAFKIKNINLKLNDVYKESVALGLLAINTRISSDIRTQVTHPFLDDSYIVGRSDDLEKIVRQLTSSTEVCVLPVIGIAGMAGKGKTALAQLIYKNEKVISCFEKRIWVCVSEHFKVENILNEMLQSLTGRNFMLTNMEAIVKKLKDELSGKCFLLVLDDVWNEDPALWECMKESLGGIGGSEGSKIIITTRSENVISAAHGQSYHLGLLSKEDSWTLFEKKAFAVGGAPKTSTLVDIGCRIVERCGGIPLAIKTIGGLMYSMKNESEWSEVEGSKTWISMDALGRVLLAIKLSYDHLPLSMKQCFAICSIYGKDSILKKEEMVQLWMAQGQLNTPRGSHWDMESIGNNYFDTLLQRSLLHDAKFNDYGRIVSCKMHDLVHDFALQVSKSYCLNLENGLMNNDMIKATHLYISSSGKEMVKLPKGGLQNLQTLFVKDGLFGNIQLTDYKYLNVLVVVDWGVNDLPSSVGKLKRLRYLDIVGTNIVRLPNEITKLYHLQTLRANNLSELPKDLGNLKNLRHIYMSKGSCLLSEIGKLTSLRTLPCIKLNQDERCKLEYLGDFNNLAGEVKIVSLENVLNQDEAMKTKLSEKENIDLLELHWQNRNASEECNNENVLEGLKPPSTLKVLRILGFAGQKLPSWMVSQTQPLHNLVKIKFENFKNCKQIPPLGHLPYLKFLEIRRLRSLKRIGSEFFGCKFLENATRSQSAVANSSIVAFPSLKHLQFHDMPEWKHWSDPEFHQSPFTSFQLFPNLEELTIFNCPKLICIPDLLSKLSSLRRLCIFGFHCDLVSIPDIGGLRSLQDLDIGFCENLSALPGGIEECTSLHILSLFLKADFWVESIRFLTNLRELSLKFTPKDDPIECFPWPGSNTSRRIEDNGIPQFGALEFLVLKANSAVKSLPEQIQSLTALKALCLEDFYDMEALPEWLGNIHSLRHLRIWRSSKLAYLPSAEAMQRLTNIEISHCRILIERCKEGGPERHKIAHIPHVYLDVGVHRKK